MEKLAQIQAAHGDVYLSIHHTAAHEFQPADDLTDILNVTYQPDTNLATIHVQN